MGTITNSLFKQGKWFAFESDKSFRKTRDVVNIPPNVKHWHGATKDSWFVHEYYIQI